MRVPEPLRRHADAVVGATVGLVYVAEVLLKAEKPLPLLATTPLIAGVLVLRRRLPIPALVLCVATFVLVDAIDPVFNQEGGFAFLATWLAAHFALGRWTTGKAAWAAPLLASAAALIIGWGDIGRRVDTGDLAFFLALSTLPWAAGLVTRVRHEHLVELRAENERLEREQEEAARRAVIEERSRIARELHDVVSHAISVTVLQARGARRMLEQDVAQVRQSLNAIEATNTAALGDMRRLLAVLRDTEEADDHTREPLPSLSRLDGLVDQVRSSGVVVGVTIEGEREDVPPGVDLSAYRIVQEALTNVVRHAGEAEAMVSLTYGSDELVVSVRNSAGEGGIGGATGHGLIGIRERVAVIGGEVSAGPVEGGGYEVAARLPYSLDVP